MSVRRRILGRTGLSVSELGFGCGGTADLMIHGTREARRTAVERALTLGINYFDTAPVYGDTASEANLGAVLQELGAQPIVATKVALAASDFGNIAGAVERSVEGSLARLGVPRIPLIQLHNRVGLQRAAKADLGSGALLTVDDVLGPEGVVAGFRALRDRGLVKFFGCSSFGGYAQCVNQLIDSGAFDALIINLSVINTSAMQRADAPSPLRNYGETGARAAAAGMGVIALRVLEGGVLAGTPPRSNAAHDMNMGRRAAAIARIVGDGQTMPQAAIRFVLSEPRVATALIGFSDVAQVEDAAAAAGKGPLPRPMLDEIERLRARDFE
jgi:L-galactose dehydrogenase/L-glyceraldehyde 3-phosphate reductase